ncbi:MAG TPA: 50S ribosomal protein L23 [Bacteroidales bacterium]|nr:50S ribosomal protein L23 [Bacteroidales bacterium]
MEIILKPVITEKMTPKGEKLNQYGFIVHKKANKLQIRSAVKELYGVEVIEVNTMNYSGKTKTRFTKGGALTGRTKSYKKAIVTLAAGETIDFYSNI